MKSPKFLSLINTENLIPIIRKESTKRLYSTNMAESKKLNSDKIIKIPLFCLLLLILGCNNTETKKNIVTPPNVNLKKDSLKLVERDKFSFRRSYIYSEEIYNNEKQRNKLDNRNPENNSTESKNSKYYLGMKKLGMFDNRDKLVLKKWNEIKSFDKNGQKINFNNKKFITYITYLKGGEFLLKVNNNKGKSVLENKLEYDLPPDVAFLIEDLDGNGNDEIISFYKWYFTNGDNYDIKVYELKP